MDNGLSGLVTGLSNSLNQYLGTQQQAQNSQAAESNKINVQQQADAKTKLAMQQDEYGRQSQLAKDKLNAEGQVTPEIGESILPGGGGAIVQNFQKQNGRLPTVAEAHSFLDDAVKSLTAKNAPDKDSQHQDTLENQAINRISSVRGDAAVARSELQRDAAGQAYDTISKAQHENRDLTQLEQTDLLAQLFQARTGKAPTDTDMKLINDKTAKQGLNQAITYFTGDPGIVGASTDKTLDNLKQFIVSTGKKADSNHEGYMGPHLIKPTGLSDDRWQHILASHRGISFNDQMTTSDKTYAASQPIASTPSSGADSSGSSSGGWSYVGPVK